MRRKSRKFKQEAEVSGSEKEENSELDNGNENHDESVDNNSDSPEPETKKRKSDKKMSKRANKEKRDKEIKEIESMEKADVQYEVQSIVDEKIVKGAKHFLIRWKGFNEESDTWEPETELNCPELIKQFNANRKNNTNSKSKKTKSPDIKRSKKKSTESDTEWDENEEFEVERIVEVHHKRDGKREFLVSWKGYPQSQNSWVQEEDMTCGDLIAKFMAKVERARESEQKTLRVKPIHTDRFTLSTKEHGRRLSKRNSGKQRVQYHDAE